MPIINQPGSSGGGGSGGPLFALLELLLPNAAQFGGSTAIPCVPANVDQTWMLGTLASGIPITFAAGNGCSFSGFGPTYSHGTLTIGAMEFDISNAGGTQKLSLSKFPSPEINFPSDTGTNKFNPSLDTFDVIEQIGADLSVSGTGATSKVVSAAGGQFFLSAMLGVTAVGVAT